MAINPGIVVCLVSYRNPEDVLRCLEALGRQTFTDFEVVICENGGVESFATLREALPNRLAGGQQVTTIADHANPGYAGGINRCIAEREGRQAYWILNPDTVPEPEALAAMASYLARGAGDAVGCPIVLPTGLLRTCGGEWLPWLGYSRAIANNVPLGSLPDPAEVDRRLSFISGASILVSAVFIQKVGLMREDYFLYGEEVEWCIRARRLGAKLCFCPDATVLHYQGTTTGSADDPASRSKLPIYLDERNRVLTLRDTEGGARLVAGTMGALLVVFWRYGRRRAWRSLKIAIEAWWNGVCNERGKPQWLLSQLVEG